jgi:hypothetical protein
VWKTCQAHSVILVTANRNKRGSESLEATIQELNDSTCLPVLTIAAPQRLRKDTDYREHVAARMLDILMHIEEYRGTGRLYLP